MEDRLPVFKGADNPKNILQDFAGLEGILPHPADGMRVGANGDNLAAQFFEPTENICRGQETAAAVYAAGVYLQAFSLGSQGP